MVEKCLIIVLINLLFYFKALRYKYSSDDIPVYRNPPKTKNKWHRLYCWVEGCLRWSPEKDHLLTILIHILVSIGIYFGFGANNISFIAAILFSINPANNQGSVWISGRSYAMSSLAMVWTLVFPWFSFPFLLVATHYNPGFLAPLALLGSSVPWTLGFALPAWLINLKQFRTNVKNKINHEMFAEDRAIKPQKFVLALKTFGFYTTSTLLPFKNTFYHSFLQSAAGVGKKKAYSMKDIFFFLGLIYTGLILWFWFGFTWNIASFGLLWWCITIAPFLNFFRMSQEIAERYMYLPNCGMMVALAFFLVKFPVLIPFYFGMYATKTWFYIDAYRDDYFLVESACLNSPNSWFAWHVRGLKRWDNNSQHEAFIMWTMARMLSPQEFKINFNMATYLKMAKQDKEAEKHLSIAVANIPKGQEKDVGDLIANWKKGKLTILV